MFIEYLFYKLDYEKIILDTKLNNKWAQHVYKNIGFIETGMYENAIYYELLKKNMESI